MTIAGIEVADGLRPVEIEVVRSALTRLSLLAQALSGANQSDPERYASTFAEVLGTALRGNAAPVVLIIRDEAVFYAGSEVSGNDLVIRSIVQRIMEQGVSSITLLPGISREELYELSNLLAQLETTDDEERTPPPLDAAAWGLRLHHIHFESDQEHRTDATEDDVRPVEVIRRLAGQMGMTEDILDPHTYLEIGAMLGGLRALGDAPKAAPAALPDAGSGWDRAVRMVRENSDVPDEILGVLVTESLRSARTPTECTQLSKLWLQRVLEAIATGRPLFAGALLRPILLCTDPRFRPVGLAAEPIRAATAQLLGEEMHAAVAAGLQAHPQTDDWIGLMFTLGEAVEEHNVLALAELGRDMESGPVREALGDGLAMAIGRLDACTMRELLGRANDTALRVLLQAARREEDPTLIEPLLARIHHDEAAIREAALMALRAQQSPRIKAAARESVDDPARQVRLEALRYLSVYRDLEAAPVVAARLRTVKSRDADIDELRALAIAWIHTSRGSAVSEMEGIVASANDRSHPDLSAACIAALARAGAPGREALDRLGRSHEHLRSLLREHATTRGTERRS